MKVADIMTKEVKHLSADISVQEALDLLLKMQISGLPVMDDNHKLLGMFTEKEFLSGILPSYVEKVGRFTYQDNPKAVKQKIANMRSLKVKELMRKNVVTVSEEVSLCEAARIMLTQGARRLPVLNRVNEVVGIVSRGDIVKALFQEYR
jgi:CBS-domain-containing membrane protein